MGSQDSNLGTPKRGVGGPQQQHVNSCAEHLPSAQLLRLVSAVAVASVVAFLSLSKVITASGGPRDPVRTTVRPWGAPSAPGALQHPLTSPRIKAEFSPSHL